MHHARASGRPFAIPGASSYSATIERVVVVYRAPSPTADLYIRSRLVGCDLPVAWWDIDQAAPPPDLRGAFVIIVRYITGAVARVLTAADALAGVAFLMDDDMPGAATEQTLPLPYRLEQFIRWQRQKTWLARLSSELWLASDVLMQRFGGSGRAVYRIDPWYDGPSVPRPLRPRDPDGPVTVFYHGQTTHLADYHWLLDVVRRVQQRRSDVLFEFIGQRPVKRLFADQPRVRVLHPMGWIPYRSYIDVQRYDIGLAPLMNTPFNLARSWLRYLNIASTGAAGIFAAGGPYESVVENGTNGVLLKMDPIAWADAIVALAADSGRREHLARAMTLPVTVQTPPVLRRLAGVQAQDEPAGRPGQ